MKKVILAIVLNVLFASITFGVDKNKQSAQGQFYTKTAYMISSETIQPGTGNVPTNWGQVK